MGRILNSWVEAFEHPSVADCEKYMRENEWNACPMHASGVPFNDAYRYMDWFLTVPLLLIEIVLVMKLSPAETVRKATILGVLSAFMVIFGYPGEMIPAGSASIGLRWLFWAVSMMPFLFIVYQLPVGTKAALDKEEDPDVKSKINSARLMTIISKCGVGILIYKVTYAKSLAEAGKDYAQMDE